jgi:hypothetical protein
MIRPLTRSEKMLLALCGLALTVVGTGSLLRDHRARAAAARETISSLEPQLAAAAAAQADAPFWQERQLWLDSNMPRLTNSGEAHSAFLEHLLETARERGLQAESPVLLKPEATPWATDLSVSLQLSGPDGALLRWLSGLQSPEKMQVVKYLQIIPRSSQPPRLSATVTVARLHQR